MLYLIRIQYAILVSKLPDSIGENMRQRSVIRRFINPIRSLHIFEPRRPEVVLGNNSALFATAASLIDHTKKAHPDVHLIKPDHWLDHVLPEYFDCVWGQTVLGLPQFARDLFNLYDPKHEPTKLITLGQFIGLRHVVYNLLRNDYGVKTYDGLPSIDIGPDYSFNVSINNNGKISQIKFGKDAYFYSWYRRPRLHDLADRNIPNRSASMLYSQPRESASSVLIILGAGLQTAWVERNFRNSRIICLRYPNENILRLPANVEVNYERIEFVDRNTAKIELVDKHGLIKLTSEELKGKSVVGEFYEGIGYEPAKLIPINFPKISYEYMRELRNYSRFVSTKNIPSGSLMESYLMWIELTNNLQWAFEPFAYHAEEFPVMLIKAAKTVGIELPELYFNALESYIKSLDDPEPEILQLERLIETFRVNVSNDNNLVEKFRNILYKLDHRRLRLIDKQSIKSDNNTNHSTYGVKK